MRINPEKRFNLAAAMAAVTDQPAAELTLSELVRSSSIALCDGSETRLRKWVAVFGNESAWAISGEQLQTAAQAMLDHGYSPAAVNRDLSALGSAYRWARSKRIAPKGFISPTLAIKRWEEPIRRVHITPEQVEAVRARALAFPDRRFGVFVSLLIDTGARKSELLDRHGRDFDLDRCQLLAPVTKNGTPRVLFFKEGTAKLVSRVFGKLQADRLLFEGLVQGQPLTFRKSWVSCVMEAGVPGLHMHDVRHAAAAALLRAGVTLPVAAQVLGHDPAVLARRYGHLETAALQRAQEMAWQQ